jgi:hypothetical protein
VAALARLVMMKWSSDMDTEFQSEGQNGGPATVLVFLKYLWYNGLQINCPT